jgi:lactate dehydrogenase-like 2-hydroxyacid dehydrogenase
LYSLYQNDFHRLATESLPDRFREIELVEGACLTLTTEGSMTMNVGILGTGDVGRALGKGFVTLGHDVKMGAREAKNEKALAWARSSSTRPTPWTSVAGCRRNWP